MFNVKTTKQQQRVVMFGYNWWLCMVINMSVQYNGGFLPDVILFDPRLSPSGYPLEYHEEVMYL